MLRERVPEALKVGLSDREVDDVIVVRTALTIDRYLLSIMTNYVSSLSSRTEYDS